MIGNDTTTREQSWSRVARIGEAPLRGIDGKLFYLGQPLLLEKLINSIGFED